MFIPKFGLGRLAVLLVPAALARFSHRGDDDEDDDDDEKDTEPGLKEELKDFALTYALTQMAEIAMTFVKVLFRMRVMKLGSNIKVKPLTVDEVVAGTEPTMVDPDYRTKAVKKRSKHPDSGNYILVNFGEVSPLDILLMAFIKRWRLATEDEAISVYLTRPSEKLLYDTKILCFGTLINRPSANIMRLAVPCLAFLTLEDEKSEHGYSVALHNLDEEIEGGHSALFRVK